MTDFFVRRGTVDTDSCREKDRKKAESQLRKMTERRNFTQNLQKKPELQSPEL
jgi:hypothetical protein